MILLGWGSGNTWVEPKVPTPVFLDFSIFLVPQLSPLPGFDGLTVLNYRGTKITGYTWISPCCGSVTKLGP